MLLLQSRACEAIWKARAQSERREHHDAHAQEEKGLRLRCNCLLVCSSPPPVLATCSFVPPACASAKTATPPAAAAAAAMNTKAASERYQRQVGDLAKQPGNDVCADCGGRMPRWASWSLGIFICVTCAAVHRKMGTHVSKVKSLSLDTWTREQVERMREVGNVKSNQKYNPDERRHRPPVSIDDADRDSELENNIFDKYKGKFMANAAPQQSRYISHGQNTPPPLPAKGPRDSRGAMSVLKNGREAQRNGHSLGDADMSRSTSASTPQVPPRPISSSTSAAGSLTVSAAERRPASHITHSLAPPAASVPPRASSANTPSTSMPAAATGASATSSVFDDLMSLGNGTSHHQPFSMHVDMPMQNPHQQMNPWAHLAMQQQAVVSPMVMSHAHLPFPQQQQQGTGYSQSSYLQPTPTGWSGSPGSYLGQSPSNLGSMAFSNPTGMSTSPSFGGMNGLGGMSNGSPAHSAQMLGQSAFLSPYSQPQQQPFATSAPTGSGFAGSTLSFNGTSNGSANPFGQFASSMMPGSKQEQAQTYARGWPGTKQNNPWA